MRAFYIGDIYPAHAPNHCATNCKFAVPSRCVTCSQPITIDISYRHLERDLKKSDHPTKSRFVGRVCSLECADMFILREM